MQALLHAYEELLAMDSFVNAADEDTLQHLRGLSDRARDACGTFAEDCNEAALVKWVQVLRRALTAAIRKFPIEFYTGSLDEHGVCKIEPSSSWCSLPHDYRNEMIGTLN